MSTSIQIAEFFARIGIKADTRQLDIFLDQMKQLNAYSKQLRSTLKNSFKVRTDYSNLPQMRNSLGATVSSVRALRAEIGRLRSTNVTANVGANINRRGNFGSGGGQGGGGGGQGGRVGFMGGALTARGMISAGLAPVAATAVGIDVVRTSMQVDAAKAALLSISDSAADAEQQFKWLRAEADKLGFVFLENARNYTNFVAAGKSVGIGAKQVQTIFSATAKYGRVLGLSNDDLTGTFRALQQMMSKGTVQSEELKGQLGERLPGAVGMAAKAMGVIPEVLFKMLQNGEVLAKDLLPKLAVEMEKQAEANGAFATSMKMTGAQLNQFLNKWNDLKDAFARSGFLDAVINGMGALATALDAARVPLQALGFTIGAVSELIEAVFNPAVLVVIGSFGVWWIATRVLTAAMITLAMTWAGVAAGYVVFFAPIIAGYVALAAAAAGVILVVEDLNVAVKGGDSQFKKWAEDGSEAAQVMISLAKGIDQVIERTLTYWNLKDPRKKDASAGNGLVGAGAIFGQDGNVALNMLDVVSGKDKNGMIPMMSAQQGYGMSSSVWNVSVAPNITVNGAGGTAEDNAKAMQKAMSDEFAKTLLAFPVKQ